MNSADRDHEPEPVGPSAQSSSNSMLLADVGRQLLEDEPDSVLVGVATSGNLVAFEVLVRRYRNLMRGYAVRILKSSADADDIVQEALITAWEKLPTLNDGAYVKAWLMRVVRNKCLDRMRRSAPVTAEYDDDTTEILDTEPFKVVETLLQNEALALALANLPTNQRRAWLMREFSDCSYALIADELDIPVSTVRGLLARSRRSLAGALAEWR
ncbi:RNA polymerase sigma factor [Cryobacterium zongtaii]|nr:RNA polymerase sigma factor [Cryobacterium zongtaii]